MKEYINYCKDLYKEVFEIEYSKCKLKNSEDKRRYAQRIAIKETAINTINKYRKIEPTDIWRTIYIAHINNFSGIDDLGIIENILSAENSWKKSSGHAFEEMIRDISNIYFVEYNIKVLLQRELKIMLDEKKILNEVRDISWLKEQVGSSVFDLYLTTSKEDGYLVFGCIQSKTSIRDRVTRDREPSLNAMDAFFFSIAIVMDGEFLKLPKFQNMVNGNSHEFKKNGWHYLYVISNEDLNIGRIKTIDITMNNLINDVLCARDFWLTQRQWMNNAWQIQK